MSAFSSSVGRTFQSLGQLARKSGEGQAFLTRFEQGQELIGNVLRQRQQAQQSEKAQGEREDRLTRLAAEQEGRRFTQALQAQKEQRQAEAQEVEQSINEREQAAGLRLRELQVEKLERQAETQDQQIGLRERDQQIQERRLELAEIAANKPKDANKARGQLISQLKDIEEAKLTVTDPQQLVQLEQSTQQITQQIQDVDEAFREAALNVTRTAQVRQSQAPVNKKEAGPKLTAALNASGQNEPDDLPLSTDTGKIDKEKLKVGRVYFIPGQGPAVFTGRGFNTIDELDGQPNPTTAQ